MLAVTSYLANKPDGIVLAFLIVALVLFVIAAALAYQVKALWATVVAAGLAFFVLAFLFH